MTPPTVRRTRAIETGGAIEAGSCAPSNRAAIGWGIVVGVIQAATPLVFWWLDSATVYALGLAGHRGDLRRVRGLRRTREGHRRRDNTRWWPPFCMTVDWVLAAIIVVEIAAGLHFQ